MNLKASVLMISTLIFLSSESWAQTCEGLFAATTSVKTLSTEDALAIARSRSTEEMTRAIDFTGFKESPSGRILIDLVQDQSHLVKPPPIPAFILTVMARKIFASKFAKMENSERSSGVAPRLKKMWFVKSDMEFRGQVITLQAHTVIELDQRDIATVLTMFVRSMYHPALGNKVFKIDVVDKDIR